MESSRTTLASGTSSRTLFEVLGLEAQVLGLGFLLEFLASNVVSYAPPLIGSTLFIVILVLFRVKLRILNSTVEKIMICSDLWSLSSLQLEKPQKNIIFCIVFFLLFIILWLWFVTFFCPGHPNSTDTFALYTIPLFYGELVHRSII